MLQEDGSWRIEQPHDFDTEDWWFRTTFQAAAVAEGEEVVLHLGGIATVSEVYLNGEILLRSVSMFEAHTIDVCKLLRPENELVICCRALAALLDIRRTPRARWRTRLVAQRNLRFFRTMLLGRAPGFAPRPAAVGPWRAVWLERRRELVVDELALRPSLRGKDGLLLLRSRLRALGESTITAAEVELSGPSGTHTVPLALDTENGRAAGELTIPDVARWWPHTHGDPVLHDVVLRVRSLSGEVRVSLGRVGFRDLAPGGLPDHQPQRDGLDLRVNGVRVFARGAVWTPTDLITLAADEDGLRSTLERARDCGMNMLRIPGTSTYEGPLFHDLCDELGILVWQDFMFANMDYPIGDPEFRDVVEREITDVLDALGGRPSLVVLCGNSEVEQQVAMLGLDPELGRGELFGVLLPDLIDRSDVDAIYVPSAPCGGEMPFRPDQGIANYYGVGGYRRPLEDVKSAGVRFAAECLAFSNVPDEPGTQTAEETFVHDPRWKAGVPRDIGAGWDFEDVRDHYFKMMFGCDPVELRSVDHDRYLELSRLVSGEVMAEVFGEWRRASSRCGGGLVLWLRDLMPGAGWGVLDHAGDPKAAYHYLRRVLAPVAVWMSDDGLNGIKVNTANDRPVPFEGNLRLALYSDFEKCVEESRLGLHLEPHETREMDLEGLIGRFLDASFAYRFGPPAQNLIVASLETDTRLGASTTLVSQAVRFPVGRPIEPLPAELLGVEMSARRPSDTKVCLTLRSRRLLYGVRIKMTGYVCEDDAFSLEPGQSRSVVLYNGSAENPGSSASVSAANMTGTVKINVTDTDS